MYFRFPVQSTVCNGSISLARQFIGSTHWTVDPMNCRPNELSSEWTVDPMNFCFFSNLSTEWTVDPMNCRANETTLLQQHLYNIMYKHSILACKNTKKFNSLYIQGNKLRGFRLSSFYWITWKFQTIFVWLWLE